MSHTQANRNIGINTPLGEDVLLLKGFSGKETLGRLFQFDLELQSENAEIKFDDIVGQNATVRLNLSPAKSRYFNGYISRFSQIQSTGRLAHYRATMVPWLWFLTRSADCRIFQEMKVPEIIQKVFREHGFTDFRESLSGQFRKWDYCVQYRETDFNFASRLMEQEGIYYFFEHENGKHTLVLADSKSAHQPYPDYGTIAYRVQDQSNLDQEYIFDWTNGKEVQPGLYCHTDFNFEKPKVKLVSKSAIAVRMPGPASRFSIIRASMRNTVRAKPMPGCGSKNIRPSTKPPTRPPAPAAWPLVACLPCPAIPARTRIAST